MRCRPHLTQWALLIYCSSRLSYAAKAAIRSFSSRRSRSIPTRGVFAANNCILIAATCVGERVTERRPFCLATRRADDKLHVHQVRCTMLTLIDRGDDIRRTGRSSMSPERERAS